MSVAEALLVMDYQVEIVRRYGGDDCVNRTVSAATAARGAGLSIIFVKVGFRPGYPEVHPRNRGFQSAKKAGLFSLDDPDADIDLRIERDVTDVVITKTRVSAFFSTGLDQVLRSQGIGSIALAGIATSGVVLSTVRDAADLDYDVTVISDCCTDLDTEVHTVLMTKVFPRQATVTDESSWSLELAK